jgi:hypothetical protein
MQIIWKFKDEEIKLRKVHMRLAFRGPCTVILITIFINCNWAVTRWQWLFYMYKVYEADYIVIYSYNKTNEMY